MKKGTYFYKIYDKDDKVLATGGVGSATYTYEHGQLMFQDLVPLAKKIRYFDASNNVEVQLTANGR